MSDLSQQILLATRKKLRFGPTNSLSVEDLWDISLGGTGTQKITLDAIAIDLHSQLEQGKPVSFVSATTRSKQFTETQLKFDIVKGIIDVRVAEHTAAQNRIVKQQERERLTALLDEKNNEKMRAMTAEEIAAKLAELDAETL